MIGRNLRFVLGLLVFGLVVSNGRGQSYQVDWYSIDGGGGTSTGGAYVLTGVIGQPDAGVMTGGAYQLTGGFLAWTLTIPIPGAPALTISRAGSRVVIAWPSSAAGFQLQYKHLLNEPAWVLLPNVPSDDGTTQRVNVPADADSQFFRLSKP